MYGDNIKASWRGLSGSGFKKMRQSRWDNHQEAIWKFCEDFWEFLQRFVKNWIKFSF
jgi:hypothetical protein